MRCLVKAFAKPLAAHGIELTTPKVKVYRSTIKTPCGRFTQRRAPAYYCSASRTIYWPVSGDDGAEAYTYARLGYVGLVAHEFGHHLQAASGMLREYSQRSYATESRRERYLLSRRLELQAQCFEGIFAAAAQSIGLSSDDRYQLRSGTPIPVTRIRRKVASRTTAAAQRRFAGSTVVWTRPISAAAIPGRPARNRSSRPALRAAAPQPASRSASGQNNPVLGEIRVVVDQFPKGLPAAAELSW